MTKKLTDLNPKKILIRSTNWIGDAIMTTPAVRTIHSYFPEARISMLAYPWVADIFAASPHVDEIIEFDKKGAHAGLKGLFRLGRELAARKFDMAILLQNAFEAAFITTIARIPVRAGYIRDARRLLLTHPVKIRQEIRTMHQVYYYQQLCRDLGLECEPDELFLKLPESAEKFAADFVRTLGKGPVVGFNPGAAYGPAKCWPTDRYGELARQLSDQAEADIIIFGAEADRRTGAEIKQYAPGSVHNMAGRTSLAQAMALIGACDAFVTNDSGLMHVGAAMKTPLVAIFGSTDHIATGPFSKNAHIILKDDVACRPCFKTHCKTDFECMKTITVGEVYDTVMQILNKYPKVENSKV